MTKLDWMLFAYGTSGWIVAWASSVFYSKAFHVLSGTTIEMLQDKIAVIGKKKA
jgi:hypothetical protein